MSEHLTLYYRPGACALAPHIMLHWLDWEHNLVNAPRDQSYRDINPSGAVPAIKFADGTVLSQCNAILGYLAEAKGRTDLLGGDDIRQRAKVAQWAAFFTGDFHPAFFPIFGPGAYTQDISEVARDKVRAAGQGLVSRRLATIEASLNGKHCFVGDTYTLTDAYAVPMIRWATTMLAEGLDPWPNTRKFYDRICNDDGVKAAMAVQGIKP